MQENRQIRLGHEPAIGETLVVAGGDQAALRSWSPRPGGAVTVVAPSGACFRARVMSLRNGRSELFIYERMSGPAESLLELIILQALPERERMELIIEKATELGADLIVPWRAERGITPAERDAAQKKSHRFSERAKKAARQCRRARIPAIAPCSELAAALGFAAGAELKIVLWEGSDRPLKSVLALAGAPRSVAVMVGPEGGLTGGEVEAAMAAGFESVSLGTRVLRTETAAMAAAAIMQYLFGDLGGGPSGDDERGGQS